MYAVLEKLKHIKRTKYETMIEFHIFFVELSSREKIHGNISEQYIANIEASFARDLMRSPYNSSLERKREFT